MSPTPGPNPFDMDRAEFEGVMDSMAPSFQGERRAIYPLSNLDAFLETQRIGGEG